MSYLPFKICRRLGENVWARRGKLTPKQNNIIRLLLKKNINQKQSDFSKKLLQWKKLAFFYGMSSLSNNESFNKALRRPDKKKSLLLNLETRLDVILVRLYFCSTLFKARQLIAHEQICVNFQIVNIPGFTVKSGDVISIQPSFVNLLKSEIQVPILPENTRESGVNSRNQPKRPYHIEANYKTLNAILLYEPNQVHFPYKIDFDFLF